MFLTRNMNISNVLSIPPISFTSSTRELGAWGEDIAESYLSSLGYDIAQRNWRVRQGELDIIAYSPQRQAIIAVEVKTRREGGHVPAWCAVDERKLQRLRTLLMGWLRETDAHSPHIAVDLIAITLHKDGTIDLDHRESLV